MKIFFDLDGTLLDSRKRLFTLFCDLTQQTSVDFETYWELKRSKIGHAEILERHLSYSNSQLIEFEREWFRLIEDNKYLDLDTPFAFTQKVLEQLKGKHQLYVVTARQSKAGAVQQLEKANIRSYFEDIFVTERVKTKSELIFEAFGTLSPADFVVGDTGVDIQTAKELGCKSLAVLSGFRNREIISTYQPDYIGDTITTILEYV
ncbi:MAG: HAD family hydrolase [Flavobacteriaceae bacterium]|nr:HAD family hydrolase [Flavobacteriaceae bacterium]